MPIGNANDKCMDAFNGSFSFSLSTSTTPATISQPKKKKNPKNVPAQKKTVTAFRAEWGSSFV